MAVMLATPTVPVLPVPDLSSALGGLPLRFELSPVALAVVLALAGIFFAVVSVVLVYHWRRFPFEQDVFDRVERWYFGVSSLLIGLAVLAIIFS